MRLFFDSQRKVVRIFGKDGHGSVCYMEIELIIDSDNDFTLAFSLPEVVKRFGYIL